MRWSERFGPEDAPALEDIGAHVATPMWGALLAHLEGTYGVAPRVEYSRCSGAPGWNVKYKKGGRALCTLYPAEGWFTCLVSIGGREAAEAELLLGVSTEYLRELYARTQPFNGSRWLMIEVTAPAILEDAKRLIALRAPAKRR